MITIAVPGFRPLHLEHLVLDFNGTLAIDGQLLPGVAEALRALAGKFSIHVLTADTFGCAASELAGLPVKLSMAPDDGQARAKRVFVETLGADSVVAIGNGRNDCEMVKAAALGIAVLQKEGASGVTLADADVVTTDILDALDLLRHPLRLVATLRA